MRQTKQQRKNQLIPLGAALLGAAALTSSAMSAVLLPGGSANLNGWSPAGGGSNVFSQSYAFTAIDVPQGANAAMGVLDQTVDVQGSGELLFGLRISQLSADQGVTVTKLEMAGWKNFSVDADFLVGSGTSSPEFIERSAFNNGGNLTWSQFTAPMSDGKNTSTMQVITDAAGFTANGARLAISFSDGSRALVMVAAPSAIPAPGAAVLMLGAFACVLRRRR